MTDRKHLSQLETWGQPADWQPRPAHRRAMEKAARTQVHQCPGCWSIALLAGGTEYECQCGERMTLIDLRARTMRPLNEDES